MAAAKVVVGFLLAGTLAACNAEAPQAPATGAEAGAETGAAEPANAAAATPDVTPATGAAPTGTGPLDGLWRCKMNGDIPLGTLTFTGGAYVFQTTNTAWEPNPNSSDGSGQVRFEENFILPQSGPLKDSFEVTGAFGDGTFINFNTNLGMMFGCRRP